MTTKQTQKPAPLGRGLSALFGDADNSFAPRAGTAAEPVAAQNSDANAAPKSTVPNSLPIEFLQPGAYQPRRKFDEEAISGLADSIKERGILQPLMVRPLSGEKDSYEIIAGERRWRAAQQAGLHEVPVIIKPMSDREAMELGLIENVQRQDLSPLEEAMGYKRLLEEFDHTQDGLAKVVGKSRPHITNLLRLLTLPAAVKAMIENGTLSMGHARTVITAENPVALAQEIARKQLSVRQAEALAKRLAEGDAKNGGSVRHTSASNADLLTLEKIMSMGLGMKVKITSNGKSGTLVVHYKNLDQFDDLVKRLKI